MDAENVSVSKMLQQSIQEALQPPAEGGEAPSDAAGATESASAAAESAATPTETAPEAPAAAEKGTKASQEPAKAAAPVAETVPDLSKRMEKLSQASNKVIAERQKLAEERKQYEKELLELKHWKEVIQNAKQDPVSFAELAGFQPDEYATALLDRGALSPERKRLIQAEQRVRAMEETLQRRDQEQAQMSMQAQRAAVLSQIQDHTRGKPDEYEMVNAWGQHEAVLQEIENHYRQTFDPEAQQGEVLDYDAAASRVEQRLVDKYLQPIVKSSKLKKLGGFEPAPDSTSAAKASAPRQASGTITSKMRAAPSTPVKEDLSEAERFQKAGELIFQQMMGRR